MKFLTVSHAPLAVADDSRLHTNTNGSGEATLLHKTFLLSAFPPPPPSLGNAIDSNRQQHAPESATVHVVLPVLHSNLKI